MSETITKETKPAATKAVPKVETKTAEAKVAPKAKAAVAAKSANGGLYDIAELQMDATEATIVAALTQLDTDISAAREIGSDKAKKIVSGFGGENKMADLIEKLVGYMGEAAGAGMIVGMSPMVIMAGAAKGVYKKITD